MNDRIIITRPEAIPHEVRIMGERGFHTSFNVTESADGSAITVSMLHVDKDRRIPGIQWWRDNAARYFSRARAVRYRCLQDDGSFAEHEWPLRRPTYWQLCVPVLRQVFGFVSPPPPPRNPDMDIIFNGNVVINFPSPASSDGETPIEEAIEQGIETMSAELDTLTAAVQANQDATSSAIQLIHGLADQITALKDDPAALQALADQLKQQDADLLSAVTANTPSTPGATVTVPDLPANSGDTTPSVPIPDATA